MTTIINLLHFPEAKTSADPGNQHTTEDTTTMPTDFTTPKHNGHTTSGGHGKTREQINGILIGELIDVIWQALN